MEWKEYRYTVSGKSVDNLVARPLVPIQLANKTGSFPLLAMVDSGTDSSVFNAEIAEALHISANTCASVKLGGIGDQIGFRCEVTLTVPDFDFSIEVPVIFAKGVHFDALLGQTHFFQHFLVRFEKHQDRFYLARPD